ncbi:hypothetical protein CWE12_09430 [Aliidiomarina sedimenti]|uniref:GGDEF-domain containing protein n=1 Tax=Aliidiomarina sedimenti TaxID=1933879 RepID=A0ABY0BXR7_9GAMM|nr:bifunctional diguanylate cyclase/phosphodiesterase [Aliidiomarina sedimenti]RUO29197.1 hypothetical protein CWE12_09430 [Aliidiomarina sedimenti]
MMFQNLAMATVSYSAQALLLLGFGLLLRHYYRHYHRSYLRFWSYASFYYSASTCFALVRMGALGNADIAAALTPYFILAQLASLYVALSLLAIGVFDIVHERPPATRKRRYFYLTSILLAGLLMLPAAFSAETTWMWFLRDTMMFLVSGVSLLSIGMLIYTQGPASIGPRLIAAAFALIGVKNLTLVQISLFSADFSISSALWALQGVFNLACIAAAAVGIIIWLLEAERTRTLSALQQAEYLNTHDALTGIENREELMSKMPSFIDASRSNGRHLSIFLVGINRFKAINDTLGIRGGDRALIEVSQRLQGITPRPLAIARMSGDVFVILFDHLKRRSLIEGLGAQIQRHVQAPMQIDKRAVTLSCGVGIARYPQNGVHADTLLSKANMALAQSKQSDTKPVVFYRRGMDDSYIRLIDIEPELKQAFANNEFTLHLQPLFNNSGSLLSSFEALVRWQHPQRGLIAPSQFLPFIEELGLATRLDDWVLEHCAQLLSRWRALGNEVLPVAVNISARHFQNPELVIKLKSLFRRYQLNYSDIELEITENVAMTDLQAGLNVLQQLQELGIRVSIDDFGTGYSSLAYLRRLPVDKIKIDRSFINELLGEHQDSGGNIVRTLIELSHGLKKRVVAEGVESAAQLELLSQMQCDQMQGYHLSPPINLKMALEMLQSHWKTQSANEKMAPTGAI